MRSWAALALTMMALGVPAATRAQQPIPQPPAEDSEPPEETPEEVEIDGEVPPVVEDAGDTAETPEAEPEEPDAQPFTGVENAGALSSRSSASLVAVVIDAAPYGVDPVVGEHISAEMRETAAEMGYRVISRDDTVAAANRLGMPYPPTPADLWRVTFVANAQRGAFARVWAHDGQYVIELTVASADGHGPFFARGTAGADDLHDVVEGLTREALPLPTQYDYDAADAITDAGHQAQLDRAAPRVNRPVAVVRRRSRASLRPSRRWDFAIQTEAAIGVNEDRFYNHFVGVRLGFRITNRMALQLYGAYANVRGRAERKHNFLPILQFENRIRISSRFDLSVPLRVGVGYLPLNGPVLRFAAGFNLPIGQRMELGIDLLTPTIWFLPDGTLTSLNIGLEFIYRL